MERRDNHAQQGSGRSPIRLQPSPQDKPRLTPVPVASQAKPESKGRESSQLTATVPNQPRSRRRKKRATARFYRLLATCIIMMLMVSYAVTFGRIIQVKRSLVAVKKQIAALQMQNEQLRNQAQAMTSDEYIEDIARQDLGLVKPGETAWVVVKPEDPKSPFRVERRAKQTPVYDAEGW